MKKLLLTLILFLGAVGLAKAETYKLVTDASTLASGDQIIIASTTGYALSTTQNNNNRGAVAVTISNDAIEYNSDSSIQIITLESTGDTDKPFYLKVGTSYLYPGSSSNNYLKTTTSSSSDGTKASITINAGVASVVFSVYTRNVLQFNPNTSANNPIFACYSSASQTAIKIYKLDNSSDTRTEPGFAFCSPVAEWCYPHESEFFEGLVRDDNIKVDFSSSNLDVICPIEDSDGFNRFKVLGSGITTLTMSYDGDANYKPKTVTCEVIVYHTVYTNLDKVVGLPTGTPVQISNFSIYFKSGNHAYVVNTGIDEDEAVNETDNKEIRRLHIYGNLNKMYDATAGLGYLKGQIGNYNGKCQLVPASILPFEGTEDIYIPEATPTQLTLAEVNALPASADFMYAAIENVSYSDGTISDGTNTLKVIDTYNIGLPEKTNVNYNVTGIFECDQYGNDRTLNIASYTPVEDGLSDFEWDGFKNYKLDLRETQTLDIPTDAPTITWASSDESIAKVENNAMVAGAAGTATITASWEKTATYRAGTAEFTVTVVDPNGPISEKYIFSEKCTNSEVVAEVKLDGYTSSLTFAKGSASNAPAYYTNGTSVRMYVGNTLTVSVPENCYLEKVEFTFNGTNTFGTPTVSENSTYDSGTWTFNKETSSATLTSTNKPYVQTVTVYFREKVEDGLSDFEWNGFEDYTLNIDNMLDLELPSDAPEITWSSSNPDVAEVEDNTILAYAAGTAIISASWEANDNYRAGSAEFTVTVKDPKAIAIEKVATFDFTVVDAYGMTTQSGTSAKYEEDVTSISEKDVKISFSGKYRMWETTTPTYEFRFQKDATLTFTAGDNSITTIEINGTSLDKISADGDGYSNGTWTGDAKEVTLTNTEGTAKVRTITVHYTIDVNDKNRSDVTADEISVSGGDSDGYSEETKDNLYVNVLVSTEGLDYALEGLPEDLDTDLITWEEVSEDIIVEGTGASVTIMAEEGVHQFKAVFSGDEHYRGFEKNFEVTVYPNHYDHFPFHFTGQISDLIKDSKIYLNTREGYTYYYKHIDAAKAPRKATAEENGYTEYTADGIDTTNDGAEHRISFVVEKNGVVSPAVNAVYAVDESGVSGIEGIEAADADAELFDLQGRRIEGNPAAGLYIRVIDGKATKVRL